MCPPLEVLRRALAVVAGFGQGDEGRELAYALHPDNWNRGLGTEIVAALVRWHHEHPPGDESSQGRLCAYVEVGNSASVRVLEKVGFTLVDRRSHQGVICDSFRHPAAAGSPHCMRIDRPADTVDDSGIAHDLRTVHFRRPRREASQSR